MAWRLVLGAASRPELGPAFGVAVPRVLGTAPRPRRWGPALPGRLAREPALRSLQARPLSKAPPPATAAGNNNNALHSQLAATGVIDATFSLCFGYPSGGGMFLGAVPEHYNLSMSYTSLLTNLPWHYYNVKVGAAPSGALGCHCESS
jgi:hypothetical protein